MAVSSSKIKECFALNTTLQLAFNAPSSLIQWYAGLNDVCKELQASPLQRRSVPVGQLNKQQIRELLEELKENSEPWEKMKLVVLGHGRIGKTTLLTAIYNLLNPTNLQQVLNDRSYFQF